MRIQILSILGTTLTAIAISTGSASAESIAAQPLPQAAQQATPSKLNPKVNEAGCACCKTMKENMEKMQKQMEEMQKQMNPMPGMTH